MLEHLLAVADEVFGVDDWKANVILAQEIGEHLLSFDLRQFTKVTVSPEEIEGVKEQAVLFAGGELGLKFGKVRASLMDDDHFPIQDCLTGNVESAGND